MKRLNFLVSLTNNDNDYQQEQAVAAREKALDLMPPGVAALQTLRA